MPKPSVVRPVHYVDPVTSECRAAIITGVIDDVTISVAVLTPDAMTFEADVVLDLGEAAPDDAGLLRMVYPPSTWHWPEVVQG